MRKLILILMLFGATVASASPFTEFYCRADGTNINAGSTTNAAAVYAYDAGNWTNATSKFYLSGADLSGVTVDMWASIWTNSPAPTNAVYVARITAVDDVNDVLTFSATAKAGTLPGDSVGGASVRVGGAWFGAYGTVNFPWAFAAGTLQNLTGNPPRVNVWSGYSNSITAQITSAGAGPITYQGYTTTPGDGGKGIIDGGGGAFTVISFGGGDGCSIVDMIAQNSAATGAWIGLNVSGAGTEVIRCVGRNVSGQGIKSASTGQLFVECEAYNCNKGNNASLGAIAASGSSTYLRCIAHDNNYGANCHGFAMGNVSATFINCLSISNGGSGFLIATTVGNGYAALIGCDSISNAVHGIYLFSASPQIDYIENCNLIANTGYGISSFTNGVAATRIGCVVSNYFGSGTQANTLGTVGPNVLSTNGCLVLGTSQYAADTTPYVNPSAWNFSLTNTASSYSGGRGIFTQWATNGPTIAYRSVGAAQATNFAGTAGGEHSHVFAQ